ncbi:MAG: SET domain-containing protein-lysine N-methyltransferase [Phenylobacterium sp.]|nr:SET domain-containing protein-lysine N-methyltransferase [Phenylobacterium sp.]
MTPSFPDCEPLEVLDTDGGYGLGVRTLAPWRVGEVVHRFSGLVSAELKLHSLQVNEHLHISETRYIGFLTHACDPNARLDMSRFEMVALKDIGAGELLTIDYAATEDRLFRQFACHCGAATCRLWITGRAEGANAEGRTHLAGLSVGGPA